MTKEVNKQYQQQLTEKQQIKKCHGNRRLQRFRRKYRSKGMNNQTIEMLLNIHQGTTSVYQDNQQIHKQEEKEMDDSSSLNTQKSVINMLMLSEN